MSLLPYIINSFNTLTTSFMTQFDISRYHDLTSLSLLNLRQEEGQSLCTFIDRFNMIAMKIKDPTPNLILHYMIMALKHGPFIDELAMRPPLGMQELRKRVTMFIRVEDMRHDQNSIRPSPTHTEIRGTNKESIVRDQTHPKQQKQVRFSNYDPLNAPRSRILDEVLQAKLIPLPKKFQNPPNANMSKYCHYHHNNGHTTEECETLCDKQRNWCARVIFDTM